ncbi:MAG: glycosyltransferase family 2 protein [Candidatus Fibromonas sp.]|jgi:glycosyltransferase involved in cell wall biosynthesis|nr:glycosyltransferase family 2 protein [Candidatus Fibromonas sp.]
MAGPILAIVVPCYNEKDVLPATAQQLLEAVKRLAKSSVISHESKIVFIDDGSKDNTWELIENLCKKNPKIFSGIKLSKNRGHQNALLCGLLSVREFADASISMDADLQDDISVIDEMLNLYGSGCDIVYGVRSKRDKDSLFKRITAHLFYRFINFLGADIIYNHADFRLMSKNALNALAEYKEVNLFLRGIVPMLGYRTGIAYYERKERMAGESKYPVGKMLRFAFEGITSLSTKPIRMVTILGVIIFIISLAMIVYSVVRYFMGATETGWPSMICSIWSIGGLILLSIGIVGEYIGKIYLETKQRPRFIVEKKLGG